MHQHLEGYQLVLSTGETWRLTPTAATITWVATLGSLMGLDKTNSNSRRSIVYLRNNHDACHLEEEFWRTASIPDPSSTLSDLRQHRPERRIRLWRKPGAADAFCDLGAEDSREEEVVKMRYSLWPLYEAVQDTGGLAFHGGLVEREGLGFLLSAPSGTGKSTCCDRLPPPWRVWSDDEALVVRSGGDEFSAHPLPSWTHRINRLSDRTWDTQSSLPLAAIFYLEQSESDELQPIDPGRSAVLANANVCRYYQYSLDYGDSEHRRFHQLAFDNACELAKSVPAYILRNNLNGRFWEKMEGVISQVA